MICATVTMIATESMIAKTPYSVQYWLPAYAGAKEWLKELRLKEPPKPVVPPSPLDLMKKEMEKAVRAEQYERAAELRDAIKAMEADR